MSKIVLDTHILVWSLLASEKLSTFVKQQIAKAQDNSDLYISGITLWEIAMLSYKKRINVYKPVRDFLDFIVKTAGLNIIQMNQNIAADSVMLPGGFNGDPADCIIIASTREIVGTLITRDRKIIDWAEQGYIKTLVG